MWPTIKNLKKIKIKTGKVETKKNFLKFTNKSFLFFFSRKPKNNIQKGNKKN